MESFNYGEVSTFFTMLNTGVYFIVIAFAKSGAKSDHKYIESSTIAELAFCNKPLFPKVEEKFNSRGGECSSPDNGYKMIIKERWGSETRSCIG